MKQLTLGVRGDLHARPQLTTQHFEELKQGKISGIIDLGDIEASYLDIDHPLRAGQDMTKESTMEAVIRNALDSNGKLTKVGEASIEEDLRSINDMSEHVNLYSGQVFRCINGNSFEVKNKIFNTLAPKRQVELLEAFDKYDWVMKEAHAETIGDTGIIYLPWKCSVDSVKKAMDFIGNVKKLGIFSHDYLSMQAIPQEFKEGMRPNCNEEQVVTALDLAAERADKIEGYFGHIGFQYPVFKSEFKHKIPIKTYHVDEKNQKLLYFKIE